MLDFESAGEGPAPGPRPFLTRAHMIIVRILLVPYVLALVFLAATNVRPVGNAVFRLSSEHLWAASTVGFFVVIAVLMFLVLLALCLHHYLRGHAGPRPAKAWIWILVLTNVAGVVAYYLRVIEPEQRALLGAPGPG